MSQKWEINRVSTPERIFQKINEEMVQPVGIVLFGADCELKDEVCRKCTKRIPNLATVHDGKDDMSLLAVEQLLSEGRSVLVVMCGNSSGNHSERHRTVMALRGLGAKSVVGFYAKHDPIKPSPYVTPTVIDSPFKRQVEALTADPPTADGLDYLIVVEEELSCSSPREELLRDIATGIGNWEE